jgi:type IV pilus assembly protein PilM
MSILSGVSDFFGLDLGASAVRAVKLRGAGPVKVLENYAEAALDGNLTLSDSKIDQQKLAQVIKDFLHQSGIGSKNVAVNLPSHRVFTTVIDLDKLSQAELAQSIRYQAQNFIPTPIEESKVDFAVIGDSPKDPKKYEVLLSSVQNNYVEARLDLLESIGLNVVAFEPDSIALSRALVAMDATAPEMILDIGYKATDIVVTMNGAPHLSRAVPIGAETMIKSVVQALGIDAAQAEHFVFNFGLGKDKMEGQIYNAVIGTVNNLISEVDKSIKYFQDRYPNIKLDRIIVTGRASTLPELPLYVANTFNINVEIGNAWRNVSFPANRQNDLLAVSNHFAVAAGLAERTE